MTPQPDNPAFTVGKVGASYAIMSRAVYDAMAAAGAPMPDHVEIVEPRTGPPCRVYWGSHGCQLERGHAGPHECDCCTCEDHAADALHGSTDTEDEGVLCVAKPPYYGPDTRFYGEDARP